MRHAENFNDERFIRIEGCRLSLEGSWRARDILFNIGRDTLTGYSSYVRLKKVYQSVQPVQDAFTICCREVVIPDGSHLLAQAVEQLVALE